MSRYLPSFQKNKTKFLHELNSKNNGPVLLLKTIFRVVSGNQSESTFSESGMAVFYLCLTSSSNCWGEKVEFILIPHILLLSKLLPRSLLAFPWLPMAMAGLRPQKRVHSGAREKQKISRNDRLMACRGGHSEQIFRIGCGASRIASR